MGIPELMSAATLNTTTTKVEIATIQVLSGFRTVQES
jgi:hypothetical protein